jgi:hypothetical protein
MGRAIALPPAATQFLKIPPCQLASADEAIEWEGPPCPLRVRLGSDIQSASLPLSPRKRTPFRALVTSARCQYRTWWVASTVYRLRRDEAR